MQQLPEQDPAMNDVTLAGMGTMRASDQVRRFIKGFEIRKLRAYPDPQWNGVARVAANFTKWGRPWTIGYGHTGPDVVEGKVISETTAENLFIQDLAEFEAAVNGLVTVPLTQGQFDALVSFGFNCGTGPEGLGGSTLLKLLNAGQYDQAADQFSRWNKSGGKVLAGLTIRRAQERAMFLGQPFVGHA